MTYSNRAPQLLPCPFCGGAAYTDDSADCTGTPMAGCRECSAHVAVGHGESPHVAWNRRTRADRGADVTVKYDDALTIYMTGRDEPISFDGPSEVIESAHDDLWEHVAKHGMKGWRVLANNACIDMSKVDLFHLTKSKAEAQPANATKPNEAMTVAGTDGEGRCGS